MQLHLHFKMNIGNIWPNRFFKRKITLFVIQLHFGHISITLAVIFFSSVTHWQLATLLTTSTISNPIILYKKFFFSLQITNEMMTNYLFAFIKKQLSKVNSIPNVGKMQSIEKCKRIEKLLQWIWEMKWISNVECGEPLINQPEFQFHQFCSRRENREMANVQ